MKRKVTMTSFLAVSVGINVSLFLSEQQHFTKGPSGKETQSQGFSGGRLGPPAFLNMAAALSVAALTRPRPPHLNIWQSHPTTIPG